MLVTAEKMRQIEDSLFASGVEPETLMDEAGEKIAREILREFPSPAHAIAVVGSGNNGADAMVALRILKKTGWTVALRSSLPPDQLKGLPAKKWRELGPIDLLPHLAPPTGSRPLVLLDGLLGIGTSGAIREPLATLAREINDLHTQGAHVIAIDVPSGLDCKTGSPSENTVRADLTLTLGMPKIGLLADSATNHVGRLRLLPLTGLTQLKLDQDHLITPLTLPVSTLHRPFDFHKGQAGRVGIIAGSRGLAGAATLCSLGTAETDTLIVIDQFLGPAVIDADALNLLARRGSLRHLTTSHVLTPHPGEMSRLFPSSSRLSSRAEIARAFTQICPATLLFKGARTLITAPDSPLAYNTTGTPAMATGGQGDVLAGIIAAFLARGLAPLEAAKFAAWLAGRASELALQSQNESLESLTATTTAHNLGPAFRDLRSQFLQF